MIRDLRRDAAAPLSKQRVQAWLIALFLLGVTGPLGTASMLKVMKNYLATANLVTLAEALFTSKMAGMDLNTTCEAIRISSGNSFVHETESQVILNGSGYINFTITD